MTVTWLPFAVRRPGPVQKQGYPHVLGRSLDQIEGEVKHSTEGPLAAALGELDKLTRQASWTFTLPKEDPPLQHYPLEAITWHSGLPGDRKADTSLIGNLTLVGLEHVDYPDNKLSANQVHWTTEITKAIRRLCPRVAANPPTLRVNLWEHNWLSPTSCPSGLIPWQRIIEGLEDDMPTIEQLLNDPLFRRKVTEIIRPWFEERDTRIAQVDAKRARHENDTALHGGGYTDAQARKAIKDRL